MPIAAIPDRLPALPCAVWRVLRGLDLEPITFADYCREIDRIPRSSVAEHIAAETDASVALVIIDRERRLEQLRARWIASPSEPSA
jgi:hypothetical protein